MVYTDENIFNCDGTDSLRSYWHDLRKEELMLLKLQCVRNEIMVWAAFFGFCRTIVVKLRSRLNGQEYVKMLGKEVLPRPGDNPSFECIHLQDNTE